MTAKTTIVEFVDFECPACRALHERLSAAAEPFRDQIEIVRRHLPLSRHPHARIAAQAYCCAEEAGAAEPMADRLFRASELSRPACEEFARELGLDMTAFRDCVDSARTRETLERDVREANELGIRSLPTIFIGGERFEGAPSEEVLAARIASVVR